MATPLQAPRLWEDIAISRKGRPRRATPTIPIHTPHKPERSLHKPERRIVGVALRGHPSSGAPTLGRYRNLQEGWPKESHPYNSYSHTAQTRAEPAHTRARRAAPPCHFRMWSRPPLGPRAPSPANAPSGAQILATELVCATRSLRAMAFANSSGDSGQSATGALLYSPGYCPDPRRRFTIHYLPFTIYDFGHP